MVLPSYQSLLHGGPYALGREVPAAMTTSQRSRLSLADLTLRPRILPQPHMSLPWSELGLRVSATLALFSFRTCLVLFQYLRCSASLLCYVCLCLPVATDLIHAPFACVCLLQLTPCLPFRSAAFARGMALSGRLPPTTLAPLQEFASSLKAVRRQAQAVTCIKLALLQDHSITRLRCHTSPRAPKLSH